METAMNDNHHRGFVPTPVKPISAKQRCLRAAEHAFGMLHRLSGTANKRMLETEAADKGTLADQYSEIAGKETDPHARRVYQWLAGQHAHDELTIRAHLSERGR